MANSPSLSNAHATLAADAVCGTLDNGYLRIYDGTKPANANVAVSTQNLLAELRLGTPAFDGAVDGVAAATAISSDTSANYSATATWFRVLESDGTTAAFDGTVGTSGCDLNLATTSIVATAVVAVSAFSYSQHKV
jgi:hypothetical protein